ncbi:restriction endonuclease subunit S [Gelidibacter japonicus]|uniref:restriction endonuclease subunit S n=1 Tax=Gelidibacter japonicus TaxID=1962232 RepID=UPI003A945772
MQKNWIKTTLGEVCFTTSGGTPSRRNDNYYNGSIPWVKSGELDKGIIYETEENITEEAIKNSSAKLFPKGTLLIALYGATIGKLAFLGIEATTNQAICGIFENDTINQKYLYHYLFHKKRDLIGQGTGGAQPNISQTILKKLSLPLPPLPEQRAIVAKIEQLFSELDNGIANLKTAQEQLKVYRQGVLKMAFDGEYCLTILENVAKWGSGGTPSRKNPEYYKGNIPWLKTGELGEKYIFNTEEKITSDAIRNSSAKIFSKNSIVIAMYGATIGKVSIMGVEMSTNQACAVAQPLEIIDKEFLYYYLLSEKRNFVNMGKGGAQPNISQGIIKTYPIPLPSIIEQHQIVQQIESRLSVCDKVEEIIVENLQKAEALRQSILKKAFVGEVLTEAEIAACKKEPDWEPAGELLKRIKKEKTKS